MKTVVVVIALIAVFGAGFAWRGCVSTPSAASNLAPSVPVEAAVWTCSMHPQIRQPRPGKCPLCAMDLISAGSAPRDKAGSAELEMSPSARKLADVSLAPVERRFAEISVRMLGRVAPDETRVAYITPRVPGRIDRLYVNFVGAPVKKGDRLADLYSPELVSAQQELIQAAGAVRDLEARGLESAIASARANLESTREKLRLWQLTPEQIAEVERGVKPREHVEFYSPLAGVVIERMDTFEGMYVETGMKLFAVADLARVWVTLDAYESDLAWLRYGQSVSFEADAYPGEPFHGTISFIDPVLDRMTRTVRVRVNADNRDGRLKPGMFAHALVVVQTTGAGKVVQPGLSGKWICPMHPEVVKDGAGSCDICGMPLVRAEDLGYAGQELSVADAPLIIPASAPLVTGARAVVYVAIPGKEGSFEGREVVLGPRAGEWYLVKAGLREGELVVANGAFKIDSSLQIQGRASMMTEPGAMEETVGGGEEAPGLTAPVGEGSTASNRTKSAPKAQATCPVMGGAISREHYADHGGYRVYFCCPGCKEPFLKEPEKYLKKIRDAGEEPETR